jgi:hypothetical protein
MSNGPQGVLTCLSEKKAQISKPCAEVIDIAIANMPAEGLPAGKPGDRKMPKKEAPAATPAPTQDVPVGVGAAAQAYPACSATIQDQCIQASTRKSSTKRGANRKKKR